MEEKTNVEAGLNISKVKKLDVGIITIKDSSSGLISPISESTGKLLRENFWVKNITLYNSNLYLVERADDTQTFVKRTDFSNLNDNLSFKKVYDTIHEKYLIVEETGENSTKTIIDLDSGNIVNLNLHFTSITPFTITGPSDNYIYYYKITNTDNKCTLIRYNNDKYKFDFVNDKCWYPDIEYFDEGLFYKAYIETNDKVNLKEYTLIRKTDLTIIRNSLRFFDISRLNNDYYTVRVLHPFTSRPEVINLISTSTASYISYNSSDVIDKWYDFNDMYFKVHKKFITPGYTLLNKKDFSPAFKDFYFYDIIDFDDEFIIVETLEKNKLLKTLIYKEDGKALRKHFLFKQIIKLDSSKFIVILPDDSVKNFNNMDELKEFAHECT